MTNNAFDVHTLCLTHAQVDRWLRVVIAKALEPSQLTMMEWLLLTNLTKHEKQGMTISEMAASLGVTLPQVTALTQQLMKKELIGQHVEQTDRRSRRLCISEEGIKISQKGKQAVESNIDHISEAPQLQTYKHLLATLTRQPA